MRQLSIASEQNPIKQSVVQPVTQSSPVANFVTSEQLDGKLNGIVEKLAHRMEPDSALTPEVRSVVKAVDEITGLRNALQSPASAGIEQATSNLVTTVLSNSLQNITGGGQQVAQAEPLRNTLAKIVVNNLSGENSPLPQILDAATNILGTEKTKDIYDKGMQYIDQQNQNDWPNIVLQLNENSQEDVVLYAQKQGYTDINYAQMKLIEQKEMLLCEVEEYQRVQQGEQQAVATKTDNIVLNSQETMIQKPIVQEVVSQQQPIESEVQTNYVEPIIKNVVNNTIEPSTIEPSSIEPLNIEVPVKANKVVVLHKKPRKLKVANHIEQVVKNVEPTIDNDYMNETNKNLNIDAIDINNIIDELDKKDTNDNITNNDNSIDNNDNINNIGEQNE